MKNSDNRVIFECDNLLLLCIRRISSLFELKSPILSNFGGLGRKEIERVVYRLLAPLGNKVLRFRLFRLQGDEHVRLMFDIYGRIMAEQVIELSAEVGDVCGSGSVHSTFVQDDPPLAPPPIHVASPVEDMNVGDEDSDEEYVADSNDSDSSEDDDEEEFIPETPTEAVVRYVLPLPHPIPALSDVPSHYHALNMEVMHEKSLFFNAKEDNHNLDNGVEFWISHRVKNRDAVMQGVKNYSICRSAEYRVVKSD
ncbi:hypothetical protein Ahy_A02g009286 isoform C [Arachis hypogaea]|uniref:Transposase MuDR plant domain-containing protein n=1 Tax=Arachis hypogaea TaxID=3818 RepID=A0A445EGM0_ARAHY|nr:hypothetical protein Ahy_A02g009286 isoform C [Arachis hypogaea]